MDSSFLSIALLDIVQLNYSKGAMFQFLSMDGLLTLVLLFDVTVINISC